MNLKVYCDGSVTGAAWAKKTDTPSDPHSWCGWYVTRTDNILIHYKSLDLGSGKNRSGNFSEYFAVRSALKWLSENHPLANLDVYSDSMLICNQLSGKYNCFNETLLQFKDNCLKLASNFPSVNYHWIPREYNTIADKLSKALQSKFGGRELTYQEVQSLINESTNN